MQRLDVFFRPEALTDLQAIYRAVLDVSRSDMIASRFVERMMMRCRKIGDVPRGGRARDDLLPGLRTVPFERSAVIAYRVADQVEIPNVFYGGRDYEALYRDVDAAS
ncbi:MAG: type II toxin-antitoxin system RelE/ParE family toxin [Rhizobiaceae bacterium]|nr:type II toxin-antitoxin system RelE/ParE family toxin [Rhizobiaceae bacterium]